MIPDGKKDDIVIVKELPLQSRFLWVGGYFHLNPSALHRLVQGHRELKPVPAATGGSLQSIKALTQKDRKPYMLMLTPVLARANIACG